MNVFLKIDNSANVALTNRLEKLHKTDLPAAVRNTLNKAAFDMKQRTLLYSADRNFENRKKNFFRANSRVEMARGNNVSQMKSLVGFIHLNARYNNYAVLELQQQEFGGTIPKRTFVPTDAARKGESSSGEVKPKERLKNIRGIVDSTKIIAPTRRGRFIKAALRTGAWKMKGGSRNGAEVVNGYVIAGLRKKMLYKINSIARVGRNTVVNSTPVYSYDLGRSVGVKSTRFVRQALMITSRKLDDFFMQEAKRRFDFRIK